MTVRRNVNITEKQYKWIKDNFINLSALVRKYLDKEMKKAKC